MHIPDTDNPHHLAIEQHLRHDLASTIAQHQGGHQAAQLADAILDTSHETLRIIGLIDGTERLVVHEPSGSITAYEYDVDGLVWDEWEDLDRGNWLEIPVFVREGGIEHWDWIHPQWRWVFEIE